MLTVVKGDQNPKQEIALDSSIVYDKRNDKTYPITKIGNQIWMAENLNFETPDGSYCYDCDKYGRLYTWSAAMDINNSSEWDGSDVKHQGVCPDDWHIPSRDEWDTLIVAAGGTKTSDYTDDVHEYAYAGSNLKSTSGWRNNGNGPNTYGFSALPGGQRFLSGSFFYGGEHGYWWSATEEDIFSARGWRILYTVNRVYEIRDSKGSGNSVRCVKN